MCGAYGIIISCLPIITRYISLLTHGVSITRIISVWDYIESISKSNLLPVGVTNTLGFPNISRSSPGAIVLHPPIDIIRKFIISTHVVKLPYGDIINKTPRGSPITRYIQSAVISVNHIRAIFRMYPPSVVVRMHTIICIIGRH